MSPFRFAVWCWHTAVVLVFFLTVPARAASPELPPLNDPPTNARLPGKFVWGDLLTLTLNAPRPSTANFSVERSEKSATTHWRT
jgi:hypothetical protein